MVKGRRHKLKVSRIQNSQSDWLEDEFEIADEVVTFYQKQFKLERDSTNLSLLSHDLELVNDEDNDKLGGLPDKEEVNRAVFKLSGDSACGPDALSGKFYQHCWDIISPDVVRMVHDFFAGNSFPKSITHTNLVLLPKKNNIQTFSDMGPITLSNFVNMILSRILHDRMEEVLPKLISANKSGFVNEKSIIENVLLAQKLVTDIGKRGKPSNVVIKLDIDKAYDRVS